VYRRCSQGDLEALTTLLYSVGDEIFMACAAAADVATGAAGSGRAEAEAADAAAQEAAAAAWRRLAGGLGRLRTGSLRARARRAAVREARRRWGRPGARRAEMALRALTRGEAPREMPEGLASALVDELPGHAQVIIQRSRVRQVAGRRGLAVVGAGLTLTVVLGWRYQINLLERQTPAIELECLQTRIAQAHMVGTIRSIVDDMADPRGADLEQAQMLERVTLVLEEISNAPDIASLDGFRYLRERVEREGLDAGVTALAGQYEGTWRADLLGIGLTLEEVANS
jgi:hypothetical protein